MVPLIFFNIGWMSHYQGPSDTDPIQGGGRYVAENQSGGEEANFKVQRKQLYGYVQPSRGSSIRLERLGAQLSDDELAGAMVVWTARHPTNGGTHVIGWYQNATVYRYCQERNARRGEVYGSIYHATAAAADAFLLPPDARTLSVPRGPGGMGQSNVWYAEMNPTFVKEVRAYIKAYSKAGKPPKPAGKVPGPARQPDILKRLAVEQKAVELTWNHYTQLGYTLTSVEKDNVGWDLEAIAGRVHLKLEVKGLSGLDLAIELTPNEYRNLNAKAHRASYRICVVTEALSKPCLRIFAYIVEKDQWISQEGEVLTFAEFVSARAYCSPSK